MKNIILLLIVMLISGSAFSQKPELTWMHTYNGPVSGSDRISDADFDPINGHIYITGVSDSSSGYNYVTIKYSSSGQVIWQKRYSGMQSQDSPSAIKYDPTNNAVYVTGKSKGSSTNFDWLTIRYNSKTGAIVWIRTYNGSKNGDDEAVDLDIDALGNIYVVGNVLEHCNEHITTKLIKYTPTGDIAWSRYISNDFCLYDELAYKVAVNGNKVVIIYNELSNSSYKAYMVGYFTSNAICTDDFCLRTYLGESPYPSEPYGMAFDGYGYMYVSGGNRYNNSGWLIARKFNQDVNTEIWSEGYQSVASGVYSWGNDILVDQNNRDIYVTGYYRGQNGNSDILTIKYNNNGDTIWTRKQHVIEGETNQGVILSKDNLTYPNLFITAFTIQPGGYKQITNLKYDNRGNLLWNIDYSCGSHDNTPRKMFRDANDNIFIAGINNCNNSNEDYLILKYCAIPDQAGAITGNATICGGSTQSYSINPVSGATSYVWTIPSGWSGTSTTNSINTNCGEDAVSGTISVKAQNSCGDGGVSLLPIIVINQPKLPIITQNENILHSDALIGNQWYNQNGIINGATSQDFIATTEGNYYCRVTLEGCSSNPSNAILYRTTSIAQSKTEPIRIYPNPVTNELTIEIGDNYDGVIGFEIINSSGQIVFKGSFVEKATVSTKNFLPGLYLIKLVDGKHFEFRKIIKE